MRRDGLITSWHKREIIAGTDRIQVFDQHLNTASIILLLVSADFVASDYCNGIEVQRAMERHTAGEAHVIPILLRPVDWQSAPFGKLQALPGNGKPVTCWVDRDAALADAAQGIRAALQKLQHLAVSTHRTSSPRFWNIPYPRNPMFTGREEIFSQIESQLQRDQATAISQALALSGLGGIGKTQVAVEYAYRHFGDYQAVFWTPADTRESLVSGHVAIAELLNLPEKDEQDQTIIIKAVSRWLRTHTEWLLILDNAEDLTIVREFVPPVFGGCILLTTRTQAMGRLALRIKIDTMPQDLGALFLLRRAFLLTPGTPLENVDAAEIAIAREISGDLGGLPLALDQAGAYIEEAQCSLLDYQQRYRTRRAYLLQQRGGVIADHPEPVAATWSLSFEKVEQCSPVAADLLRLCAFLHPDAIPTELVTQGVSHLGLSLASVGGDDIALDEAIATLRTYSLIHRDRQKQTLSIHRLVQAVLQDTMDQPTRKLWAMRAVLVVDTVFPSDWQRRSSLAVNETFPNVQSIHFAIWQRCEEYLPHVLSCATLIEQEQLMIPASTSLLTNAGNYLSDRVRYGEAELLLVRALTISEQLVATDHSDTAIVLNSLAELYRLLGKYEQAEPLHQRALAINEQQLGVFHPSTAGSLNNLASLYDAQGRYEQAEPLYKRALAITEQGPETEPFHMANLLNNFALNCFWRGEYEQAEPLFVRSLSIREQQLGADHPDTARTLNNLAGLYSSQGKYEQAKPLYMRALLINEQLSRADDPSTADCLANLAHLYQKQGRYEQAEPLYQRALSIRKQQLGSEHTHTASSLIGLAELSDLQGKYEQVEPFYQRALSIYEQRLGLEHPETGFCLVRLAAFYIRQGKREQGELLVLKSLRFWEQRLGPEHPDVITGSTTLNGAIERYNTALSVRKQRLESENTEIDSIFNDMAASFIHEGKYIQALVIWEPQWEFEHPDMASALNNLALLYYHQGWYEQTESLYQRALSINEQKQGSDHLDTAFTLNNLGELYSYLGKYEQAESLHRRVLAIREQHLEPHHLSIADSLHNLAIVYVHQEKYGQAEPLFVRALPIWEQHLGLEHLAVAQSLNGLAEIYKMQGKYGQAELLHQRALTIRELQLGSGHLEVANSLLNLALLYKMQGKYIQAEPLLKRALAIYELQGATHPHILILQENYIALQQSRTKRAKQQGRTKRAKKQ